MLDAKDKEYIADEIRASEKRMITYFDNAIMPKFNALFDLIKENQQQQPIETGDLTERIEVLETVVKQHSNEIRKLKQAQ